MAPFFSKFGSFSLKDISIMFIMSTIVAFICWHLVVFFNKLFEQKVSFSGLLATTTIGTFIVLQCLASLFSYFVLVFNHGYDETTKFYNLTDQLTHIGSDSIFIIFSALFYQFLYFNETRATEKKAFKSEIGKQTEKYESLRRQLSPHFLFNNINVLTGLIEENPEKAVHFSESLGNIYRHFLRQEDQDVVSLQSALTFSKDYLELLKYRYEEAFQYVLPKKVDSNHYIIPLALQQVIENVIKHNEISNEMPLQITIGIQNDYLIVQNTKQLKTVIEATKGTGIENIKTRYAYLTEKEVSVQDSVNSFTIKLPLLNMENA
jgi:LytS/YehU family sensor histidine kinase